MSSTRTHRTRRFLAAVLAAGTIALASPAVAGAGGHGPTDEVGIPDDPCDFELQCPTPDDEDEPDEPCILERREDEPELDPTDDGCGRPERVPEDEDEPEDEPRNPDVVTARPNFTG
jgi:hypothetical protein